MKVVIIERQDADLAGSSYTMREFADIILAAGHEVHVVTLQKPRVGNYFGLPVTYQYYADRQYREAGVFVVPHWPTGPDARKINRHYGRPIIYVAHHAEKCEFLADRREVSWEEGLITMNDAHRAIVARSIPAVKALFFHPHVSMRSYLVPDSTPTHIAFVNSNALKGAALFNAIARLLPQYRFLVVRNYYDGLREAGDDLANIEYVKYQDIRNVFRRTKILLAPSVSDSWNRVAHEAMCSGIPVLYTRPRSGPTGFLLTTEGVEECVGSGGIGLDSVPEQWVEALTKLMEDAEAYNALSTAATARAMALDTDQPPSLLLDFITGLAMRAPPPLSMQSSNPTKGAGSAAPMVPVAGPRGPAPRGPTRFAIRR